MAESSFLPLPSLIRKRDGTLVPFDPDEICQAIFAATEAVRQPNAFLAREMTESVLHFLAQDHGPGPLTTNQIIELTAKVMRELGQAELAHALQAHVAEPATVPSANTVDASTSPEEYLAECRRRYSMQAIFSRDLLAAQDEGWLTLLGLEHPAELEGGVVDWPGRENRSLLAAMLEARQRFGGFLALDGPEYALTSGSDTQQAIAGFARDLRDGLASVQLPVIINLNAARPPSWAEQPGAGPLFCADASASADTRHRAKRLFDAILAMGPLARELRIDWHLNENGLQPSSDDVRDILGMPLAGAPISFVLDRPDRPLALGEGLTRKQPALLQAAGLHLGPLADMPGVEGNIDLLLRKLMNLARMAISAGVQKRHFLRRLAQRHHDLRRGFFLDRARLLVIPVGLAGLVQRLTGQGVASGKLGQNLAHGIIERLGQALLEAGRSANLDAVLDSPWWIARQRGTGSLLNSPHLTGLTCADFSATLEDQLRGAGLLHESAGAGTATLLLPANANLDVEQLSRLLHFAWKKTDVVRIRLAPK